MNTLYEFMPKRSTKREIALLAILAGAAAGLFAVPMIFRDMQIQGLFQASAFVCICGAIWIFAEFLSKDRLYSLVEDEDGRVLFVVTDLMSKGKKADTACRIALDNIERVEVFDNLSENDVKRKKEFVKMAKKDGRKRYSFYPELAPALICSVWLEMKSEKLQINIIADKYLVEKLCQAAEDNKNKADADTDTDIAEE